ncbi:MAG TPA: hypothetical protein LFW14_07730, partial [Rickettsia endosymbiont of Degeeriella rufa]|nr:hypothetical protein [Rickettsia endosymbiont of Degeeriella rufa]
KRNLTLLMQLANQKGDQHYCRLSRILAKKYKNKSKKEPKLKVVSSDGDLLSQLHDTLERRRKDIAGESSSTKQKKVVHQAAKLTEQEIARKKAENLAKAAKVREANQKKWEETARQNEEIARKRREAEAAVIKARIEEKRRERGEVTDSVINGVDPAFHHNIVTELRSEIASLREKIKNQDTR